MTRTTPARPLDVEAVFPELAEFRGAATRLHPRPGAVRAQQSSIGGPLSWPSDEPWPTCPFEHRRGRAARIEEIRRRRRLLAEAWTRVPGPGGRPGPDDAERELLKTLGKRSVAADQTANFTSLLPFAQLFARDVPGIAWPQDTDLLQLLWCPYDAHGATGYEPFVTLVWRRAADVAEAMAEPPLPEAVGFDGYVPEPCELSPERVLEHRDIEELPERLRARIEDWDDEDDERAPHYESDLSIAPGWKVGGFPAWPATGPAEFTCACGKPMGLLMTIAGTEWQGDNHSWIPEEDRAGVDAHDASAPTQVVVGRGGSMHVFVCSADPRHPVRLSVQG